VKRLTVVGVIVAALLIIAPLSPAAYAASTPSHTGAVVVTVTPYPSAHGSITGIVASVCHSLTRWREVAQENGLSAPYTIQPGQHITVRCSGSPVARGPVVHSASSWVHPVPGATCVSGFRTAKRPRHNGIDLPRAYGTPIHSAAAGTVVVIRYEQGGAGWYVMVSHGRYSTVYMHMRARSFRSIGEHVVKGAVIGYVGATGDATRWENGRLIHAYHVHFEVHIGTSFAWAAKINPAVFLRTHGVVVRGC
jgi:murein DD-endopeptidase MepM/ murein hydrolase activator NlpD